MRSPLSFVRRFGLTHPTRFPSLHLPAFRPIFRAAVRIADVFRFPHFYFRLAPRACLAGALAAFAWRAEGAADEPASSAPTDYVSRSWITDHGLPHNVVTRVQQDHVGYLWLATLAGLTRFDGREFKVFPVPTDSARRGRNIRDLAILDDNTIVFLPASGGLYQLKDNVVSRHPLSKQLENENLLELYVEPGGAMWFEAGYDLLRCDHGRIERFGREAGISRRMLHFSWATDGAQRTWIAGADVLAYYRDGKLVSANAPAGVVYRVAPARSGGVWVFGNGLLKWENETLTPVADAPWAVGRASARYLYEDRSGVLWVASSREGVYRYDGRRFLQLPDVEPAVEFVTEDREGNIWLATDGGGLRRLRAKAFTLIDAPITSVGEDSTGALWFAGQAAGPIRLTGEVQEAFPFRFNRGSLQVSCVSADLQGNLWLGSPAGVFQTSTRDPKAPRRVDAPLRNVRVLFCTRSGDLWVASGGALGYFRGGVFKSVTEAIATGTEVTSIAEDGAGRLWFGTARGALYELENGALMRSAVTLGIGEGTIHAIVPDASGTLWLATTEGLLLLEGARVHRFTEADGLPGDIVLHLVADDAANLWLGTPRGLFRLSRAELLAVAAGRGTRLNPVAYGPEQGLFGISPITNYQPATWKDRRGDLWFCTYKGVVGIHPGRLQHDALPPPVLIDEVRLNDRAVDFHAGLRTRADQHRLEFRFAALSFAAPEHVQLRHQLEGFDADWVETGPDRAARYSKLPPGNYRLRVIASNSEGIWNHEGAALAFTVLPAWWQTAWFRALVVIAFAALVGWGARYWSQRKLKAQLDRLEREHALEKERARIARDMHDELGGSVTGINLVVQRLRDRETSDENGLVDLLDRRVRRLTVELERVVWTVSPTHSSLDQLAVFIERFAHNLFTDSPVTCRVLGAGSIPARPLNPECQHHVLAVTKEAINNVLKHSRATEATIVMHFENETFTVSVSDNGIGFAPESQLHSERNGLRNMRTRIAEIHGSLSIRSTPGAGTEVTVRLPTAPVVAIHV